MEPGGRGAEGIEQSDLDQVVTVGVSCDVAARLADVSAHRGGAVRPAGIIGELLLHEIEQLGIELHGIDRACPVIERLQHVRARAGAEHEHARPIEQVIRKRGGQVIEIRERLGVPVVARERARPVAVDEDTQLQRRLHCGIEAQARCVPERYRRALDYFDQADRTRTFRDHLRSADRERLAQVLVFRGAQAGPVCR